MLRHVALNLLDAEKTVKVSVKGKRVSKFIPYPGDPGHHFEIVPK